MVGNEHYYYTRQHGPNNRFHYFLIFISLLSISIFFLSKTKTKSNEANISKTEDVLASEDNYAYPTLPPISPTSAVISPPSAGLEKVVQNALTGVHGTYAIVVKNLKTEEYYLLNEHASYPSASLYKLWIMAETYRQIENGMIKESDIMSDDYQSLNKKFGITPESDKYNEGNISMTVNDALNKMITVSDNYAAFLLTLKIKLKNVESFLKIYGFNESSTGVNGKLPATTAYDTALFFEMLYAKQLFDEENSDKMLNLLKYQKLNAKIPKFLPDEVVTAHKTGELNEYTHDAGIVYLKDDEYILVVLSKSDNPKLANNRISNVSEAVYKYFAGTYAPVEESEESIMEATDSATILPL